MDYAGPFQGIMFLVIVDAHSKWMNIIPVSSTTSVVTIDKLRSVFATHGLSNKIVIDTRSVFTSEGFADFMQGNEFIHVCSVPFYSVSTGLPERALQFSSKELAV